MCARLHIGINDLETWCKENDRQDLLDEWDYEKNGNLRPSNTGCRSSKKVWWIGRCGHKWDSRIDHRTTMHCNCPYCSGRRVLAGFNDLQTKFPTIALEWHPTKNDKLQPFEVTAYSKTKVWWKCKNGHEWEASVDSRTGVNKTGCPYCAGKCVILGVTDLDSKYPELSKEWHPIKNGKRNPTDITSGSGKRAWWLGKCGHEWQATISDRVRGRGCPYCANRKLLIGFNDLQTKYPEIAREWHPTKNGSLKPVDIIFGSSEKVWWKCENGHEWVAIVKLRTGTDKTGCPYCSRRRVINGINDFQTLYPQIAAEWNYQKNGEMKPSDFASGTSIRVWWRCTKGHEWKTAISSRTCKNGTGCPYCSNKKIIPGFNDLASSNPQLAKEWNYDKNQGLVDGNGNDISTPDKVSPVSGNRVWWKCEKGHEWKSPISSRANGTGCPFCSKAGTSVPEQGVAFYLEQVCRIEQRCKIAGNEIDVYLPDYKIGIEYDGMFYHKADHSQKEITKDKKLYDEGIRIIRIKESDINRIEGSLIYYKFDYMNCNYNWALQQLCQLLVVHTGNERFNTIFINAQRDLLKIRERIDLYIKKNSVSTLFPYISKEWDYEKNGVLTPEMFTIGSDIKVWWKCVKGHQWKTSISHRTSRGDGCPYCSGKRMLIGYNDFSSWCIANDCKYLLDEWDYDNNAKPPSSYSIRSHEKVWWKCSKGHRWFAGVGHRAEGHGCPYCSGNGVKQVRNIETNEVFKCLGDAAKAYEVRKQQISRCCLGQQETAGGYHWEYIGLEQPF